MKKHRVVILLKLVVIFYIVTCVYFWATQDQKIFRPLQGIASHPGRLGIDYTRVKIDVGEGDQRTKLNAFWVPSENRDSPVILYLHGQDANIGKNLWHILHLYQSGYDVLAIDYRGFGESAGSLSPSEERVCEDAEAAWDYLTVERCIADDQIFIYGHSLGAAIAIELATHHHNAGGLIVEGAFTSIADMAKWKMPVTHLLPVKLLLKHPFDSLGKIADVEIPKLFIHGEHDEKVPYWMSEKLHAKATEPKIHLCIEGGDHSHCCLIGLVDHKTALQEFISESLKR